MKIKKILIRLLFFFSFLFLILPIFFGAYEELDRIFNILKYEEEIDKFYLKGKELEYSDLKTDFLKKTDGIFGVLELPDFNFKISVCCEDYFDNSKKGCFKGIFSNFDCILIKVKNDRFLENCCFLKLEDLGKEDEIYFSCFGESKKFKVEQIKVISSEDEEIGHVGCSGCFSILIDVPYGVNSHRILLKSKEIGKFEKEEVNFLTLFFESEYLMILVVFLSFIFIVLFIILLKKLLYLINLKKNMVRKKYVVNMYNFK